MELQRFRDLAIADGLVAEESKSEAGREKAVGIRTDLPDRQEVATVVTRLVANMIEVGLHSALLLNPLADGVSMVGEEGGVVDLTGEHLSKRWRTLALRLRRPLGVFRFAFPVAVLVFSLI